ncbi:MAG TPA: serine hydrolase domain-containing protein [Gemmatimonadaceae bacterium]|nr:serine hydrolase domain-containing protein [Gemmatimonadaceae bacterium]
MNAGVRARTSAARSLALALCTGLLVACDGAATAPPAGICSYPTGNAPCERAIAEAMQAAGVPAVSVAIVRDGRIDAFWSRGVADASTGYPVTPHTYFQVGDLSASVTAYAAMRLVQDDRLSLDADVNDRLVRWRIPPNDFMSVEKVTLRRLLSHTAGLSVESFDGYARGDQRPSLVQVLDGAPPATSPPVRVVATPGSVLARSAGGYAVVQLLLEEVTARSFFNLMQGSILPPLGMTDGGYFQPLVPGQWPLAASGHHADGSVVPGAWRVYPQLAASGLWLNAEDMARFVIEVQRAWSGDASARLRQGLARTMLAPVRGEQALGFRVEGAGETLRFVQDGATEGFRARLIGLLESGYGAVIFTNGDGGAALVDALTEAIARDEGWPRW